MASLRKILFVNGSAEIEGDTRVLINTARTLDPGRFRAACITPEGPTARELRDAHIDVIGSPLGPGGGGRAQELARMLRGVVDTYRAARNADLVYTYDRTRAAEVAYIAARLARKPLVFHAHYPLFLDQRRLRRHVAFHADRILANSRYVAGLYERAGAPAGKMRVVLLGVDAADFADGAGTALRASLGIPDSCGVVGTVGRLSPFKGQEEVIRAAAMLRDENLDVHVVISGRDTDESVWTHGQDAKSYRAILERARDELGMSDRVHILGFHAAASDVYAASDVVALPSHAEPFGLVVVEAMLAERAVVSCAAGGPLEIIDDGETGLLVPPQSPEQLAQALRRLLSNDALRERIARAGYERANEYFTLERYARDFEAAIADL